jgi:hypothetical protein
VHGSPVGIDEFLAIIKSKKRAIRISGHAKMRAEQRDTPANLFERDLLSDKPIVVTDR